MVFFLKKRYQEKYQELNLYRIYFALRLYIRQERKSKKQLKTDTRVENKFPKIGKNI